jgi:hypothetical protein
MNKHTMKNSMKSQKMDRNIKEGAQNNIIAFPIERIIPKQEPRRFADGELIDVNELLTGNSKNVVIASVDDGYYLVDKALNTVLWKILPGEGENVWVD